jgi:hypothetical protein
MAEVKRGQSSDGRHKNAYPDFLRIDAECERAKRPGSEAVEAYIKLFCGRLNHAAAQYTNGITA